MTKLAFALVVACCLLTATGVAYAGWFGPSKDEVSVKFEPPVTACEQQVPCCWGVCFRITNGASKALQKVEFSVTGTKSGRSTKYRFRNSSIRSDAIIQPGESKVECYEGTFGEEYNGGLVCDGSLKIEGEVWSATFE